MKSPIVIRASLAGIFIFFIASYSAFAAELTWLPSISIGQEYNDNFNLNVDAIEVWAQEFSGAIDSNIRSDNWDINLYGSYFGSRVINRSTTDLDQDSGVVELTTGYSTEQSRFELNGGVVFDQPSSSQLESGNRQFNRVSRIQVHFGPSWIWQWNESTSLQVGYVYTTITYEDDPSLINDRSDYLTHSASSTLTHQLTEDTQIFTQGSFVRTENDDLGFSSDKFVLLPGMSIAFSESFSVSVAAGGVLLLSESRGAIAGATTRSSSLGFIGNLGARKRFENTTLSAGFSNNLAPSINGGQVTFNSLSLGLGHQLTEQLSANIGLSASQSESIQSTLSQQGRRNISMSIRLSWEIEENATLNAGYRYSWQEREQSGFGAADRNTFFVSLNYQWSPFYIFE